MAEDDGVGVSSVSIKSMPSKGSSSKSISNSMVAIGTVGLAKEGSAGGLPRSFSTSIWLFSCEVRGLGSDGVFVDCGSILFFSFS